MAAADDIATWDAETGRFDEEADHGMGDPAIRLWALPDPANGFARWVRLLTPAGRLVVVEGRWATGGGLRTEQVVWLVEREGRTASLARLTDTVSPGTRRRRRLLRDEPGVTWGRPTR